MVLSTLYILATSDAAEPKDSESVAQQLVAAPQTDVKLDVKIARIDLVLFTRDTDLVSATVYTRSSATA